MIRYGIVPAALAIAACGGSPTASTTHFSTVSMISANEVPPKNVPAATGHAEYVVNGTTVTYTVTYAGLSGPPTISHIHVGTPTVSGGVVVGFTLPAGLGASGNFTGTFTSTDVKAGTAGGVTITAGDLNSLLTAFAAGNAYTNIHTTLNPGGEIRGQILPNAQ